MRCALHGGSLALGAALGVLVVLGVGAAQVAEPETDLNAPAVGRFQVAAGAQSAFVIDSMTGTVWASEDEFFYRPKVGGGRILWDVGGEGPEPPPPPPDFRRPR